MFGFVLDFLFCFAIVWVVRCFDFDLVFYGLGVIVFGVNLFVFCGLVDVVWFTHLWLLFWVVWCAGLLFWIWFILAFLGVVVWGISYCLLFILILVEFLMIWFCWLDCLLWLILMFCVFGLVVFCFALCCYLVLLWLLCLVLCIWFIVFRFDCCLVLWWCEIFCFVRLMWIGFSYYDLFGFWFGDVFVDFVLLSLLCVVWVGFCFCFNLCEYFLMFLHFVWLEFLWF